jgi:predicted  nucleic acid-binding Zn-ribbon protein
MSDYERQADDVERELDDMEHKSERLEDEIKGAREDWERKKNDSFMPSADDPEAAEEDVSPEADEGGR